MEERAEIFNGEIIGRNLKRFLSRMNNALKDCGASMPDFEIKEIAVNLTVDIGGNVGLLGMAGIDANRSRSFQFILSRKQQT